MLALLVEKSLAVVLFSNIVDPYVWYLAGWALENEETD